MSVKNDGLAIINLIIAIYITMNESETSKQKRQKAKRQREIERKEIDMVRKSNEILLHLIQDEHRQKRKDR